MKNGSLCQICCFSLSLSSAPQCDPNQSLIIYDSMWSHNFFVSTVLCSQCHVMIMHHPHLFFKQLSYTLYYIKNVHICSACIGILSTSYTWFRILFPTTAANYTMECYHEYCVVPHNFTRLQVMYSIAQ